MLRIIKNLKQIYKNSKAKSKYQKYLHKYQKVNANNVNGNKIVYPSFPDAKSTRNAHLGYVSKDRNMDMLIGGKTMSYLSKNIKKSKGPKRKSSRGSTSRHQNDPQSKKSFNSKFLIEF